MQCPSCLEDLKTQLEGDSIPEEDIINPQLVSGKTENQVTSTTNQTKTSLSKKPGIYVEIIRKYILRKKKVTTNKNNILAECIDR